MIYVDKYNGKVSSAQEQTWVDDIYYSNDNTIKTIIKVYKGNKLLWELVVGFILTSDDFILECKDNFILKCKNQ